MNRSRFLRSLAAAALALIASPAATLAAPEGLAVKSGQKIAFLGDSITEGGAKKEGYITFVMDALNKEGLGVTAIPAGKSGNRSPDMLARLEPAVLSKKPDWMVLSCGVNDVWHFTLKLGNRTFTGVPLEDYKKNIREIVAKAEAAGIRVLILTSTMIGEDPEKDTNQKLIPYNDFLCELAREKKLPLADLNKDMREALKKIPDQAGKGTMFGEPGYKRDIKNKLTTDGCHMNKLGNIMMAKGILRAFGLPEEKVAAAEKSWLGQ